MARAGVRGRALRGVRAGRGGPAGGAAAGRARGPDRGRPGARPPSRSRLRARGAGLGAREPRAALRAADARPLPERSAGRGARVVPAGARRRCATSSASSRAPRCRSCSRRSSGTIRRSPSSRPSCGRDGTCRRRRRRSSAAAPSSPSWRSCCASGSRLVTLTGAGGIGKTRLALRAGHELAEAFADGVYFVDLSHLTDPELRPRRDRGRARAGHAARRAAGRGRGGVPRRAADPAAARQLRGGRRRGAAGEPAAARRPRAGRPRDEPDVAAALGRAPVPGRAAAPGRRRPAVRRAGPRGRPELPPAQRGVR